MVARRQLSWAGIPERAAAVKCHGFLIAATLTELIAPAVESSAVVAATAALTPLNYSAIATAGSWDLELVGLV